MNNKQKEAEQKKLESEQAREEAKQTILDYKQAFGTPAGKKVLAHLIDEFHDTAISFVAGCPEQTAYNEGRRSIVLQIRNTVNCDMKKFDEPKQTKAKNTGVR